MATTTADSAVYLEECREVCKGLELFLVTGNDPYSLKNDYRSVTDTETVMNCITRDFPLKASPEVAVVFYTAAKCLPERCEYDSRRPLVEDMLDYLGADREAFIEFLKEVASGD